MKPAEVSTPSDREVLVKRSFDAPVNLVWRAYTEPALMRRWLTAMPGWIPVGILLGAAALVISRDMPTSAATYPGQPQPRY